MKSINKGKQSIGKVVNNGSRGQMMKKRNIKAYIPLILIELYLAISYLLYRYGCYMWPFRDDQRTLIFMLLMQCMFGCGYILAVRCDKLQINSGTGSLVSVQKVMFLCCIISSIIFIPMCKSYTNSWYPPLIRMLLDPQGVYYGLAEVALNRTGIRIWGLLDVFPYMLLPLTIYKWDALKKKVKIWSIFLVVGYLLIYLSSGRNISVAVQMMSVVAVWLSVAFRETEAENHRKILKRTTVICVAYILLVVSFFGFTMSSRIEFSEEVAQNLDEIVLADKNEAQGVAEQVDEIGQISGTEEAGEIEEVNEIGEIGETEQTGKKENVDAFAESVVNWDAEKMGQSLGTGIYEYNGLEITEAQITEFNKVYAVFPNYTDIWSKAYVNTADIIVRNLPASLKNIYVIGSCYITNGYNCLTVSLHSEHKWTYGIGHSTFLSSYFDLFFHTNISERTYYSRLTNEQVYPLVSKSLWPSTFVQWADDLTFVGVIFFMGVMGSVIARTWLSIIKRDSYWGVLLLGQFVLWTLFLPANNILENSGGFFITFWTVFIMWLITEIKVRKEAKA